jgi:hypothetical protein
MKILAIAVMVAAAGTASARNIEIRSEIQQGSAVTVCVEAPGTGFSVVFQAEGIASKMFAAAGVAIAWRGWHGCPADAIRITLSEKTLSADHPDSYGYALPFEGTHIVLFWDRIRNGVEPRALPYLAAHVMVHEVTHILQGEARHSRTGVMKAKFTVTDVGRMQVRPLPFTEEDVELMQRGLLARRVSLAQIARQ